MRFSSSIFAGTAIAGIIVATTLPNPARSNPVRPFVAPHVARGTVALPRARMGRTRGRSAITACSTESTNGFVGEDDSNVAGASGSAVLGGSNNAACGLYAAIGGGTYNVLATDDSSGDTSDFSFIGGGQNVAIDNSGSFIGAGGSEYFSTYESATPGVGNEVTGQDAFVGAGDQAVVSGNGSFVGAGGYLYTAGKVSGAGNGVSGDDSFLGAGDENSVTAPYAFLGSGVHNVASGALSFVGAGEQNAITGTGSFIGAGGSIFSQANSKTANLVSGTDSFLGAGDQNRVEANEAFLGSGAGNTIASAATYGSLIGGRANTVSGLYATVIGGHSNTASGSYAIVAGGNSDTAAGLLSFAAGYHASSIHTGSFVWSDYSAGSALVGDTAANQFVVRASGGTEIYSNEIASAGVSLAAGSGTWSSLSDRNAKTDVVPLDDASILARVAALPVSAWRYTSERGVRHVGPMAQDFYAAFGVGEDDRHITSIDEDGIALSAIKALQRENVRLRGELEAHDASFERRLAALEARSRR